MSKFDPTKNHRHSIWLAGYDHSQAGAFFVTIVAYQRECLFGDVVGDDVVMNEFGMIVKNEWECTLSCLIIFIVLYLFMMIS